MTTQEALLVVSGVLLLLLLGGHLLLRAMLRHASATGEERQQRIREYEAQEAKTKTKEVDV